MRGVPFIGTTQGHASVSTGVQKDSIDTIFTVHNNHPVAAHPPLNVIAWLRDLTIVGEELPRVLNNALQLTGKHFFVAPRPTQNGNGTVSLNHVCLHFFT
jgi:hypothetical protein